MRKKCSWAERGWCRFEHTVWELTSHSKPVVFVNSARPLEVTKLAPFLSVGEGAFTLEADRQKVGKVLGQLLKSHLHRCLERGELVEYRLRLNLQTVRAKGLPYEPVENLVPGVEMPEETDPLARFLHQNGFRGPLERDVAGWSPLCYAVMSGDPRLVAALLDQRANPNDIASKGNPELFISKRSPALHLCARYHQHEAMELLLSHRASVHSRDSEGVTALQMAAFANNAAGVARLCRAGSNPLARNMFGGSALYIACSTGSLDALKELHACSSSFSLSGALAYTFVIHGSMDIVHWLVDAGADVDELYMPSLMSSIGVLLAAKRVQDCFSSSKAQTHLGRLAYHHYKATPLMLSILSANFDVAAALVRRGARLDLRNSRGKTAADLAAEMFAPEELIDLLKSRARLQLFELQSQSPPEEPKSSPHIILN